MTIFVSLLITFKVTSSFGTAWSLPEISLSLKPNNHCYTWQVLKTHLYEMSNGGRWGWGLEKGQKKVFPKVLFLPSLNVENFAQLLCSTLFVIYFQEMIRFLYMRNNWFENHVSKFGQQKDIISKNCQRSKVLCNCNCFL